MSERRLSNFALPASNCDSAADGERSAESARFRLQNLFTFTHPKRMLISMGSLVLLVEAAETFVDLRELHIR